MSVGKTCMDLTGLSGGPLRSPMEDLKDEERKELEEVLKEMDVI